jgi:hypothetical protein
MKRRCCVRTMVLAFQVSLQCLGRNRGPAATRLSWCGVARVDGLVPSGINYDWQRDTAGPTGTSKWMFESWVSHSMYIKLQRGVAARRSHQLMRIQSLMEALQQWWWLHELHARILGSTSR